MKLNCLYFDQHACRSCPGLESTPQQWRQAELLRLEALLPGPWLEAVFSPDIFGARTKAKFVVGGDLTNPKLGRVDEHLQVIDLRDCQLHHPLLRQAAKDLVEIIRDYHLVPYDIKTRTGELKYIILQLGQDDRIMLRFVLRSKEALDRIRKFSQRPETLARFPVVSVNIQPHAKAVLEGDEEIVVSKQDCLAVTVGGKCLFLGPKSFVQTNLAVAGLLYQQAAYWLKDQSGRVLDLFCGVGGFSAHLAHENRTIVGVELSKEAIEYARKANPNVEYVAMDAWEYIKHSDPFDIIVVNPPRRGLGPKICQRINDSSVKALVYSSCNPETLKEDLRELDFKLEKIQAFEMFPLTSHWEVLTYLTRN